MSTALLSTFDDVSGKSVGADEIAQFLAVCLEDRISVALPQKRPLAYEADLVTDFEDGVHVMSIDYRGHVELLCKVVDQAVDQYGCIGVKS